MRVGYVRGSTKEDITARQDELIAKFGVEKVYTDKVNGRYTEQPELQKLIEYVRSGDIVVVESINQIAQNSRDLLDFVELLKSKQVHFISQKDTFDTLTPIGKFIFAVFGAVAELEQKYLS